MNSKLAIYVTRNNVTSSLISNEFCSVFYIWNRVCGGGGGGVKNASDYI